MRICILSKYPPIQGGVSAQNYWLARGLAERGHEVHVVTNADEVDPGFRIDMAPRDGDPPYMPGLTVWQTETDTQAYRYIPSAKPFVSKLAALAAEVVNRHCIDVLYAYYLEPYAVAAHLVSAWTGVPYVVRHAGSDIGRLIHTRDLRRTHAEVLARAALTLFSVSSRSELVSLGVSEEHLHPNPGFELPFRYFNPGAPPMQLASILPGGADGGDPLLGVYGKIGEAKGSFDLLAALGRLWQRGVSFRLLAACHGFSDRELAWLELVKQHGLSDRVTMLPFMPPWRVPSFLRALTAVAFLEREFPIRHHTPRVPSEALACGTCLVVSAEAARKQAYAERLAHGHNAFVVQDPRDHEELASSLAAVLADPARAREVGARGHWLVQNAMDHDAWIARHVQLFERAQRIGPPMRELRPRADPQEKADRARELVRQRFPVSAILLGPRIHACAQVAPSGDACESDLCDSLAERVRAELGDDDPLHDLVRWEAAKVPRDLCQPASLALFRRLESALPSDPDLLLDLCPVVAGSVVLEAFSFDMVELEDAVRAGRPLADLPPNCSFYAFQSTHGGEARPWARTVELAPRMAAFLAACDGQRSARSIAAEVDDQAAPATWAHAVRDLFEQGLLLCCSARVDNASPATLQSANQH